jgi:cobalamin 5'-phosphate synthase/cobalamin synthase
VAFLTRIPVHQAPSTPEAIGRSASVFPLVGALVGIAQAIVLSLVRRALPPSVSATLVVITGILLTGALHLDGLADMADGFGGGRTRDDVLRIMRDHSIGTYGAIALIATLLLQIGTITSLIERDIVGRFLIVAPALSRWTMVLLGRRLPYARPDDGLGRALTDHVGTQDSWSATLFALVIAGGVAGWSGVWSLVVALAITLGMAFACRRRIGGVTGDTLGATAVLCETAILLVAVTRS